MKLLQFLLQTSGKLLVLSLVTGLVSGSCSAGLIAFISRSIAGETPSGLSGWLFFSLGVVALLGGMISQVALIQLSQTAIREMRLTLARQILAADLHHLERLGTPRLLATLTDDVQMVSTAIFILPAVCIDLAIVLGCFCYIAWLSWQVLLLVTIFMVAAIGSCLSLIRRGKHWIARSREEQDQLYKLFEALTQGIKELKLNVQRRQAFLTQQLLPSAERSRQQNIYGLTFFAVTRSWGKLLFVVAIGFVLFILPNLLEVSRLTLSGYVLTFTYLLLPMENLVGNLPIFSRSAVALEKITQLGLSLSAQSEPKSPATFQSLKTARSSSPQTLSSSSSLPPSTTKNHEPWQYLCLQEVCHTYQTDLEDQAFTLGPIQLSFQPGEIVFIVGGNGSGKSTLAKLITGLYQPQTGAITLDGQVITSVNLEWYRQHFAVVFADFYLFDQLLGLEGFTVDQTLDELAQTYLERLQLDRKVKILQGCLSTTALSQGQRKRLALLTAYLDDRPIYLFDEWAADQDPSFKAVFYREILPELKRRDKTVFVISHDDQYFECADRLITLNYGQVVETTEPKASVTPVS